MAKRKKSAKLRKKIPSFQKIKPYLIAYILFLFILLITPRIVAELMPCLQPISIGSYNKDNCMTIHALDYFVDIILVATALILLALFFLLDRDQRSTTLLIICAIFMAATTIFAYYIYMKQAEERIIAAPIYFDPETNIELNTNQETP